jgi:hypothetical protein
MTTTEAMREGQVLELMNRRTARSKEHYLARLEYVKEGRIIHGKEDWSVYASGVKEHFGSGREPWATFFGVGGFDEKSIRTEMQKRRDTLHEQGKQMLMVEHFGQGVAALELGADRVIVSGLTKYSGAPQHVEQIVGDALSEEKTKEMYDTILRAKNENSCSLQAVFFRPVGGLSSNSMSLYAFRTLYKQLRQAYELLDEDGLIFIGTTGTDMDVQLLQNLLLSTGCQDILMLGQQTDRMGIRKKSSVRASLPTEEEYARANPDAIKKLIALDERDAEQYRTAGFTKKRI